MTLKTFFKNFCSLVILLGFATNLTAQNDESSTKLKNQVATNLALPLFDSFDLSYERVVANKWAVGAAAAIYGYTGSRGSTENSLNSTDDTNYEIMPFVRVYFSGTQKKSHFMELFGSITQIDEPERFIRGTNSEGFGVYELNRRRYTAGGLGIGYGYRFLLLNNKLVLEGQLGIRTNFITEYFYLNVAPVRTGIKVGYRF